MRLFISIFLISAVFILSFCFSLQESVSTSVNFAPVNTFLMLATVILPVGVSIAILKKTKSKRKIREKATTGEEEISMNFDSFNTSIIPNISFKDVAGLEEVKEELWEVIDFLKAPSKYERMGAKLPRGVLFYGPPGTGKTMLAKAVAKEGNATFHFASGSEFVEKYVGVGAKRVRILFEKAKREAPSIIFIDEIDAIGAKRTTESNNEKDQTLNQLLVEMDGFNTHESVIVIAATNRSDLLDEALVRPGRFDRQIYIGNPDLKVREEILSVHFKNKPLAKSIKMKDIAKRTPGMSGAHLANIANEAAILAVRYNKHLIEEKEIDMAIEKVMAGPERKGCIITEGEKKKIAFHEAGHALISKYFGHESVPKVSIIPRGRALGYTMQVPEEDRYLITAKEMRDKIQVLFGGRAAEELMWNELSSGARDDLKKANDLARQMVCELGMSSLGNIVYDQLTFKENADKINSEICMIIESCYSEALNILKNNEATLSDIAKALMEKETLIEDELDEIIQRREISPPNFA